MHRIAHIDYVIVYNIKNVEDIPLTFYLFSLQIRQQGDDAVAAVFRADRNGTHRGAFEKNKKKIYATQTCCGICGKPVDMSLKYPHPLSKCIDHIIPLAKGGHPSDIENLQLAHWTCNRQKSDKLIRSRGTVDSNQSEVLSNRLLPQSMDWTTYRG